MKTAVSRADRRGPPTPHEEVENNSMWPATQRPQGVVDIGQTLPKNPAGRRVSPCGCRGAPPGSCALKYGAYSDKGPAHRGVAEALIARAVNPIVRANIAASTRRALRAPTKARCMVRALKTRNAGRIARREWELARIHFSFAPHPTHLDRDSNMRTRLSRRSSFSDLMLAGPVPVRARQRLRPWRQSTFVRSPFGDASTQAGVKA